MTDSDLTELVGKTIKSISIDGDEQRYLAVETNAGPLCFVAEGDCCSESWFADLLNVRALLGFTVLAVKELEAIHDVQDARGRQEYDEVYGYKVTTIGGGVADIIFRNSSNGYYGGWLERCDPPDSVRFVEITEDYQA